MAVHKKSTIFDLVLITIVNVAVAIIAIKMDLLERFYHFSRDYEALQLDELIFIGLVLLISAIYFITRRWRESLNLSELNELKASKDPLTKLLNRRTLERSLSAEWDRFLRYHDDFCIVLFDIDDFSLINESLGYVEGDRVLIEVANMLVSNTRKTDFCARWGEEEFLILCPVCKSEQAMVLAEKLRATLYRTLKDGVELSASFSVAQSNKSTSLEELMKRVHFSLHKAKHRGKNCVVSS